MRLSIINDDQGYCYHFIYASCYRLLAEKKAESRLSKHFIYWYLEENGFEKVLQERDLQVGQARFQIFFDKIRLKCK